MFNACCILQVKVALVTRNTTQSVDAFFNLVGQEWRQLFSEIRTREFKYVKPDKRLLLELAEVGVVCGRGVSCKAGCVSLFEWGCAHVGGRACGWAVAN